MCSTHRRVPGVGRDTVLVFSAPRGSFHEAVAATGSAGLPLGASTVLVRKLPEHLDKTFAAVTAASSNSLDLLFPAVSWSTQRCVPTRPLPHGDGAVASPSEIKWLLF